MWHDEYVCVRNCTKYIALVPRNEKRNDDCLCTLCFAEPSIDTTFGYYSEAPVLTRGNTPYISWHKTKIDFGVFLPWGSPLWFREYCSQQHLFPLLLLPAIASTLLMETTSPFRQRHLLSLWYIDTFYYVLHAKEKMMEWTNGTGYLYSLVMSRIYGLSHSSWPKISQFLACRLSTLKCIALQTIPSVKWRQAKEKSMLQSPQR